jgi:O-antigen/teichoic acid export membrane protein
MAVLLLAFTLQDGILTGLRKAPVILLENTSFAVVKLGALIGLAALLPATGIVVAWVAPVLVAVVVISYYLLKVAIPRHEAAAEGKSEIPTRGRLFSFVSAEYSKAILSTGTTWVLPLLVTAQLGSVEEAYFYIPWLINYSAVLLPYGISAAYVVESAFEGEQSLETMKKSMKVGAAVVVVCTLAEFFVVPLVLHLAGPGYAENGTTLVRILALTLPFNALNALYGTFAWMEQKLWRLVILQGVNAAILLTGSILLMDTWGINAVGISYLAAQVVLGLGSVPPILRRFRAAKAQGALSVTGVGAPPTLSSTLAP